MKYLCVIITLFTIIFPAHSLELLSFNTGLAYSYVPYATGRKPFIISSLLNDTADIICLQEIWDKKDRKEFITKLKRKYPYHVSTKRMQKKAKKAPVCNIKDLFGKDKFFTCIQSKCKTGNSDEKTACYQEKCGYALRNLRDNNNECAGALMAKAGKGVPETLLTLFRPYPKAGLFAYKGEIGLLLLSRYPIKNSSILDWKESSTLNHRAAIKATITDNKKDNLVYCTHLAAEMGENVPYTGVNNSWEHENFLQGEQLIINSNAEIETPTFLMGDFNCSFQNASENIADELPNNCQQFIDAGFSDPLSTINNSCTFCKDNVLTKTDKDTIIDHIFIKNVNVTNVTVTKTKKITITNNKNSINTNLSDHFGVRIQTKDK